MTYNDSQQETLGEPIELFRFTGLGVTYRFTSAAEPVVYDTHTYLADTPISSSVRGINQSELLKNGIDIRLPSSHAMVLGFIQQIPSDPIQATVFRGYGSDFVTCWKGEVLTVEADGPEATIKCRPLTRSLERRTLRLRVMNSCNHVLYDTQCRVPRDSFRATGTIDSITNGFTLRSSTFAAQADQYYRGGALHISGTTQGTLKTLILDHVGDTVKVQANLGKASAGLGFSAWPGCDHLIGTCDEKFNNMPNFFGYTAIPSKNPFIGDALI